MNKKNIILIMIYSFFNSFLLYRACDVLYYISKGINNSDYIQYITIGSVISIVFMIPLGVVKDLYNRKWILLLSNAFLLLATLFYIFSNNAFYMGIGIILSTISNLLAQGIVISLLHNYIKDKDEYSKIYYQWSIFYYSGYLISMVLGGIVAKYSLILMYELSLIPIIINFIVLFLLDSKTEKEKKKSNTKYVLKEALTLFKEKDVLRVLIITEMLITPTAKILAESHPEYLSNMGASTVLIGLYTAGMCLLAIIGNKIASSKKHKISSFIMFVFLYMISIVIVGLIHNYLSITFILLFQLLFSISNHIYITIVQKECQDSYRQTVLAIFTFLTSISEIIICTVTSNVVSYLGLGTSYILLGVLGMLGVLLIIMYYNKTIFYKDDKNARTK